MLHDRLAMGTHAIRYSAARWLQLFIVTFVLIAVLPAQDIIDSIPRDRALAPVLREQQPVAASRPPAPPENPFKFGLLVLRPSLGYSYMNAEGLPSADGRRVASEIHTVTAGLSLDLGENWSLDYSPTWRNYTARAMTDSFDQSASLSGAIPFRDLGFQFTQTYAQSTPTLVEIGRQSKQEAWSTSLSTSYSFNPSVQFSSSASMNEQYTDIGADMRSWSFDPGLVLVFSPRLTFNLGPGFTYNEIDDAPDLYSESYEFRLNWLPTDKLTFGLNAGMQYSHSRSAAGIDHVDPVLDFTLGYQPFPATSLTFTAAQTVAPSLSGDQVTDSFRWSVSLSQRLLGRLYFNASYAPYDTTYHAINTADAVDTRKDSVNSYNANLSTQLFGRLLVAVTFSLTENESNLGGFSFSTKQYGVRLNYSY